MFFADPFFLWLAGKMSGFGMKIDSGDERLLAWFLTASKAKDGPGNAYKWEKYAQVRKRCTWR